MNKIVLGIVFFLSLISVRAQELNAEVIVNAEQTGQANLSVFKTLQRSLSEFVNQNSWTENGLRNEERISCSFFINITNFENQTFSGTIQVQSSRPVFGSTFITPVFNFNDEQFNFTYQEFEPLNYSQNSYTSNLVSVMSYYIYTILGLDADSFEQESGTPYFQEANRIVTTAQQGNSAGWKGSDGTRSRYRLNADLLSGAYLDYRTAIYKYHRLGLDVMHKDPVAGKKAISASIQNLKKMNESWPNSLLMRVFFDAKAQEIEQIFSGGPEVPLSDLIRDLNRIAPMYAENWRNIQF